MDAYEAFKREGESVLSEIDGCGMTDYNYAPRNLERFIYTLDERIIERSF